jgi:hypothetical protein
MTGRKNEIARGKLEAVKGVFQNHKRYLEMIGKA